MKVLKNLFKKMSLLQKLLTMFLTVTVCPLILITGFFYKRMENQLLNITYENMYSSNQQISKNVEAQLDVYHQISTLLYTDEILHSYLTAEYTKDSAIVDAYRYINSTLYSFLAANPNVASIELYIPNHTLPEDGLFIRHYEEDLSSTQYLEQLYHTSGNVFFSNVFNVKLRQNVRNVIYLGRVLNYKTERHPYGMLTIGFYEDLLYNMIEVEAQTKSIYLLNDKNQIISSADKALLNTSIQDILGEELLGNKKIITLNGQKHLLVCEGMNYGWKTVSVTPLEDILDSTRKSAAVVIIIAFFSFSLAIGMIIIISRYLSRRLNKLNEQTVQIEQGNFITIPDDYDVDEIGQLSMAFNQMSIRLKSLINELYVKEIEKRDAELFTLQSQIDPHFLYNTLSSISAVSIQNGDLEVSQIIEHLARFYQLTLNMGYEFITLEQEITLTKHYLAIQHMRFEDNFLEYWEIDETLLAYKTLKLMLQPFVENAINHAMYEEDNPLIIKIRISQSMYTAEPSLLLEIEDNGCGIPDSLVEELLSSDSKIGYGIKNVQKRIHLAYGETYGIQIESVVDSGTKIIISLPLQENI